MVANNQRTFYTAIINSHHSLSSLVSLAVSSNAKSFPSKYPISNIPKKTTYSVKTHPQVNPHIQRQKHRISNPLDHLQKTHRQRPENLLLNLSSFKYAVSSSRYLRSTKIRYKLQELVDDRSKL